MVSRGSLSAKTALMVATRWRAESSLIFLESDDGAGVRFIRVEYVEARELWRLGFACPPQAPPGEPSVRGWYWTRELLVG